MTKQEFLSLKPGDIVRYGHWVCIMRLEVYVENSGWSNSLMLYDERGNTKPGVAMSFINLMAGQLELIG